MSCTQRFWIALGLLLAVAGSAWAQPSFLAFESGPVRPIALTPNGTRLLVTNIPDNQLEIFRILIDGGLEHLASVPVGMEPVAVAARSDTEAWVVNHLSDSVSVVDLNAGVVAATVRTRDELLGQDVRQRERQLRRHLA